MTFSSGISIGINKPVEYAARIDDRSMRIMELGSMLVGVLLLYLIN